MGTNYYARVHLGKSSFDCEPHGSFYWATDPDRIMIDPDDPTPIVDEYGEKMSVADFQEVVAKRRQDRSGIGQEFS